jgi:hypothetical protein
MTGQADVSTGLPWFFEYSEPGSPSAHRAEWTTHEPPANLKRRGTVAVAGAGRRCFPRWISDANYCENLT